MGRTIISELEHRLKKLGTKARAEGSKAYMKSDLEFYGVMTPDLRSTIAELIGANPDLGREALIATARACFAKKNFDLRSAAAVLLERRAKLLEPEDLPALIDFVVIASCWAHVDLLATKVLPHPLAKLSDKKAKDQIRRWAKSPELWIRRAALLVQHDALKKGQGDFALFCEIAVPMLDEKVFWIRKAIGWVLREVSKKRPELVRAFIKEHGERMSGVTMREAAKYV